MRKNVIIVMMLILCTVVSYANIGYESMVKFNERILELKLDLQKQLLMKKYSNQVIGSFDVQGDTVLLKAYSIPLEGEKSFSISEVRNVETFEVTKSSSILPDVAKGTNAGITQGTVVKGMVLGGLLMMMALVGIVMRNRNRLKQRKAARREEKIEEKERIAA